MTPTMFSLSGKTVFVAGHKGMVGQALVRRLRREDCAILTVDRQVVDLRRQAETEAWFAENRPQVVFLAAAKVGGILANRDHPAEFLYDNLMIETNVLEASHRTDVEKLMLLGSSCVYPRDAPQPIAEDALLSGPLETTNEAYAVSKIAGIMMVRSYRQQYRRDFIAVQPTNLYGPGDNFDPASSHVAAALLSRFHQAKVDRLAEVVVWGTGTPRREFLYVDDLADACVFVARHYSGAGLLNIGTGKDISIADFAKLVARIVGYTGRIAFDTGKPDGTRQKLLDVSRMRALGWSASTALEDGLVKYYAAFLARRQESPAPAGEPA